MARFLDGIGDLIHKAHAEAWLNHLERSDDKGAIVAHNWRTDPNVAGEKVGRVAGKLAEVWQPGQDPLHGADSAVQDDCLCAEETACRCDAPSVSRIVTFSAFYQKILNRDGAYTGAVTEENVDMIIANLDPTALNGQVEGSRPIAWCTPTEELEATSDPDTLRSILGLPHGLAEPGTPDEERFEQETLVELKYQPGKVSGMHLPTVLEARGEPRFRPSSAGAHRGQTMDLRTGEAGVSEYVHKRFLANRLDGVEYRGRLSTDDPQAWKSKRLSEIKGP